MSVPSVLSPKQHVLCCDQNGPPEKQPTELRQNTCYFGDRTLDPGPIRNYRVLRDYDNPVAYIIGRAIHVGCLSVGGYYDALTDPGILIDDRTIDHGISAYPDGRPRACFLKQLISFILVKVRTHDHRIPDGSSTFDNASDADHRPVNMRVRNDASLTNDRMPECRGINFTGRKKSGPRVNRR